MKPRRLTTPPGPEADQTKERAVARTDEAPAPAAAYGHGEEDRYSGRDPHFGERQDGYQRVPPASVTGPLLKMAEVVARVRMARSTIYRAMDRNEFPLPFKTGNGKNVWAESVIDQYIERLIADQPSAPPGAKEPTK